MNLPDITYIEELIKLMVAHQVDEICIDGFKVTKRRHQVDKPLQGDTIKEKQDDYLERLFAHRPGGVPEELRDLKLQPLPKLSQVK